MPPWGAGSKPKKTPANTVKNSTFSTSNRFGGPPSVSGRMGPQSGPPGSGRASQISRPAMAAAATARGGRRKPVENAGTPPRPSQSDLSAQRYAAAAKAYKDPATYAKSQATAPSPNELAGMRYQRAAETYTKDPAAYAKAQAAPTYKTTGAMGWQPSQQELMRAATSGAATAPAASRVAQKPPAAPSFSQEELMRAATSGAATHPAAQAIQQAAPAAAAPRAVGPSIAQLTGQSPQPAPTPGPSANMLVQGSQGAQEVTRNQGYTDQQVLDWLGTEGAQNLLAQNAANAATAAAPAWDPANNDAPITGPVGMWTDPNDGGQMPDPADADAWQAMQDAVDKEFGPGQNIYNPEYDTERFSTYDPSNTVAPFAPSGWGGGYGTPGSGAGAGLGTYDPFTGEYLQFGEDLAGIESQRGMIDEADAFWDMAHDRKWDEVFRQMPGVFNSRGMLDSGLFPRATSLALSDQDYEQSVQDWQVANQQAALDAQQAAAEKGLTAARSGRVFDPWSSGYRVGR
jgi:hypothetical protein